MNISFILYHQRNIQNTSTEFEKHGKHDLNSKLTDEPNINLHGPKIKRMTSNKQKQKQPRFMGNEYPPKLLLQSAKQ